MVVRDDAKFNCPRCSQPQTMDGLGLSSFPPTASASSKSANWTLYLPSEAGEFFQIEGRRSCATSHRRYGCLHQAGDEHGRVPGALRRGARLPPAAELALDSTDSQSDRKSAWDKYAVAISRARRANAIETAPAHRRG